MPRKSTHTDDAAALADEATLLARYLLSRPAPPDVIQRYVEAHSFVIDPQADTVTQFVQRHPWSLPYLDAASAKHPDADRLRRKLLLMAALLETCPDHADVYLQTQPVGKHTFILRGSATTAWALVKLAIGTAILQLAAKQA